MQMSYQVNAVTVMVEILVKTCTRDAPMLRLASSLEDGKI